MTEAGQKVGDKIKKQTEMSVEDEILKQLKSKKRILELQLKKDPYDVELIRKLLLWDLYCLMFPRRSQEYNGMKLHMTPYGNYWDNENNQFIIREQRTKARERGKRIIYNRKGTHFKVEKHDKDYLIIVPPEEVTKLIKTIIKLDPQGTYLFPDKDGYWQSSVQFNRFQNSVLGLSTIELRKVMICKYKKIKNLDEAMGFIEKTAKKYRRE